MLPGPLQKRLGKHSIECLLFALLFLAYAYFHQGGGWNQNVRFNQARSMVESGELSIDAYSFYQGVRERGQVVDVQRTTRRNKSLAPNSFDIATYAGRGYPNKPPGVTLLALPAYAVLFAVEKLFGVNPDGWAGLTANLYLMTVFSVGLLAAFGGVLFLRLSRQLFPYIGLRHHLAATLAVWLGTLLFPYSTLFFDHAPAAVLLLVAFTFLYEAGEKPNEAPRAKLLISGVAAGLAVLVNYACGLIVICLAVYGLLKLRQPKRYLVWIAGGLGPAVLLAAYHGLAFGSVLATSYTYQNQQFVSVGEERFLGVFGLPDPTAIVSLLFSARLGLLTTSPVLFLCIPAFFFARKMAHKKEWVYLLVAALVWLLMTSSFNHWHGGAAYGPRYLVPIIPYLGLPLVYSFYHWPRITNALSVLSITLMLWVTTMSPMVPWSAPELFGSVFSPGDWGSSEVPDHERLQRFTYEWDVSSNTCGVYEGRPGSLFPPESVQSRRNAFNLGEFVRDGSFFSVAPLVLLLIGGVLRLRALQRRRDPIAELHIDHTRPPYPS